MDWNDANKAFVAQVPVLYYPAAGQPPIRCKNVAEITLKRDQKGNIIRSVGCMDATSNCMYSAKPEQIEFAEVQRDDH